MFIIDQKSSALMVVHRTFTWYTIIYFIWVDNTRYFICVFLQTSGHRYSIPLRNAIQELSASKMTKKKETFPSEGDAHNFQDINCIWTVLFKGLLPSIIWIQIKYIFKHFGILHLWLVIMFFLIDVLFTFYQLLVDQPSPLIYFWIFKNLMENHYF